MRHPPFWFFFSNRSRVSCRLSTSADKHVPLRQSSSKPQWTSQPPGCGAECFFGRIPRVPCEVRHAAVDWWSDVLHCNLGLRDHINWHRVEPVSRWQGPA
ncbi:hypothetical protein AMELA_G00210370 [Ameiurus melas]|uniref:Uncharacterized protein n=1 Tax=Ameiurus melas TaxID=219545 RepID=A0A7J6A466_AMEME|nr:hypothetical protein AMELA_G00210370 [Ameiurus melas]